MVDHPHCMRIKARVVSGNSFIMLLKSTGTYCLFFISYLLISFIPNKQGIKLDLRTARTDTFSFDKRLAIFLSIDSQANELWHSKQAKLLKQVQTNTFTQLPFFVLTDKNKDGKAEEFAYVANLKSQDTREFGFFFDMNNDGKADYIVYNGGPLFTKDFSKMYWMNYHAIDRNGDGRVDIFIFNAVHLQGEEMYDEGISAWLYDQNFDGVFEQAEYLGKNFQKPIEKINGDFLIKTALGDRTWKEDTDMRFWNGILKDINAHF